jgi:hypothetical protein
MTVRFEVLSGRADLPVWRARVAGWAEAPSAPIDPSTRDLVLSAAAARDWQGVITALEACDASEGSRFETFAWADRLLAVDLARDVGH